MGQHKAVVYVLLTFDFEEWEGKGAVYQADLNGKTKRVVDVLKYEDIPATFFLDADTTKKYPESVRSLREGSFELALHSDYHFNITNSHSRTLDFSVQGSETQMTRMRKAVAMIREVIPEFEPKGFRAPGLRWNEALYVSLRKLGFLYDTSQQDKFAFQPFLKNDIVVFPVNCGDYDSLCYKFGAIAAVNVWRDRFEEACQFAAEIGKSYFVLVAHPAVIGRSRHIGMLRAILRWIDYIAKKTDVQLEFKTCHIAATQYLNDARLEDKQGITKSRCTSVAGGRVAIHRKPTGQRMIPKVSCRRPISLAELLPGWTKPKKEA